MNTFRPSENTLVVGAGALVRNLLNEIRSRPGCKYRITGVVTWGEGDLAFGCGCPALGAADNLHRIIQQYKPDVIIVEPPVDRARPADRQLLEARVFRNVRVEHAQEVYERVTGKLPLETYAPDDIIYSNEFLPGRAALTAARLLSIGIAGLGLILLAPLMLLIALLIRIDSAGPVIFSQARSGMAGRSFRLLKFRTMVPSDQRDSEWEEDNVGRITRVGRWLRKARLDELPQFLNVLRGDMNIVGPRPHPTSNFELFVLAARNTPESGVQIPYYSMRQVVRPGITGWAQVRYRYANNLDEEMEKLRFDLYYLKHYSPWFDIRILFETIAMVFVRSHQVRNPGQGLPRVADTATGHADTVHQIHRPTYKPDQQAVRRRDTA